ncbi:translation initiation factor IF-3 [candidate division WWE3 bacterium]|nr:translation initiation factor IF-3 [candidate division WWE3 bacterium]
MEKRYLTNGKIRAPKLRVITGNGDNLGVMDRNDALKEAKSKGLDLVLVAEKANPPVAKILDFNKFLYEENKKAQQAKAGSKKSELKEFRFGPTIEEGDLQTRIRRTRDFLKDGDRVKITIYMRGREMMHPQNAFEKIEKMREELDDIARVEKEPKKKGNLISTTFVRK